MTIQNKAFAILTAAFLASGLAACADDTAPPAVTAEVTAVAESKTARANSTPKPGAAVDFDYAFRFQPEAGQSNTVTVTMAHNYRAGTLALTATAEDGVSLFAPTTSTEFALSGPGEESWEISFEPEGAGVAYINISAEVSGEGIAPSQRSYSIRVDSRSASDKATADSAPVDMVIMEAEETISE